MGAQLAVKQLQGKGNVVVFTMPEQANLKDRLRGYNEAFWKGTPDQDRGHDGHQGRSRASRSITPRR